MNKCRQYEGRIRTVNNHYNTHVNFKNSLILISHSLMIRKIEQIKTNIEDEHQWFADKIL